MRLCAGMRLLCKCCSRCMIVFNRHHCAAQVRCERRYGMAHAGASRCIAARCHRYAVSHRMSHTQDGGRVHVSSRQHAPRACTPPWPLLNFTVKNHLTGVWCNESQQATGCTEAWRVAAARGSGYKMHSKCLGPSAPSVAVERTDAGYVASMRRHLVDV